MIKLLLCLIIALAFGCSNFKKSTSLQNKSVDVISIKIDENLDADYFSNYEIDDDQFGTKTRVVLSSDKRIMITNGLPNHTTGKFPNEGNPNTIAAQNLSYNFTLKPVYTGKAKWAREPGVALNGVKFEPETAEAFVCETGERYRIEAFQSLVNLGLDSNHAHVQPSGAYHYHGIPTGLISLLDKGEDLILVGFAHDGFPIYFSKSGKYKPSYQIENETRTGDLCSYITPKKTIKKELKNTSPDGTFVSDWKYVSGLGELDECNGITIKGQYMYFVTASYPYVGRCLMGEFKDSRPQGPHPGGRRPQPRAGSGHGHSGEHPHRH